MVGRAMLMKLPIVGEGRKGLASFKVSKFQGFRVNVKVKFEEPSFA